MKIEIIPYSFDNYAYLLICEETGEAAVVDPGEAYPVQRAVADLGVNLTTVLCTHHHGDHVAGVEELLMEKELHVACHHADRERIFGVTLPFIGGDRLQVGQLKVEVFDTPGHTLGSLVYHVENAIFTGDTLFGAGCGRLFEGTATQLFDSLTHITRLFPEETKLYFGHEYTLHNLQFATLVDPMNQNVKERVRDIQKSQIKEKVTTPSTLGLEMSTNPFLRCGEISLPECTTPCETFVHLRKMRDTF